MILQLNPTIPLDTDKGPADAHFLIDYGSEQTILFVCFVRATGECWTYDARKIRLERNITMGIRVNEPRVGDVVREALEGCLHARQD